MDKDIFGFAEAIRIDDLSDEDFKIVELIFKDFEQIAACRLDNVKLARKGTGSGVSLRDCYRTP